MVSALDYLASPAPTVEPAVASPASAADANEPLNIQPAIPTKDVVVERAPRVEPATLADDPMALAPSIIFQKQDISHLSVEALRTAGADFESPAGVIKGCVQRNFLRRCLPFFYEERDFVAMGEIQRFVFVKGDCIFVYGQETDPSPFYAIQLETITAMLEDPRKPDKDSFTISPRVNTNEARENLATILLKDRKSGKLAYQITFDTTNDKSLAKRFLDVVHRNSKNYGNEVISASAVVIE